MDEELIELLAQNRTWLNPNLALYFHDTTTDQHQQPPDVAHKRRQARENLAVMFPRALRSGVRIVAGTDGRHGEMWFELSCMVQLGMSPMEAILAATRDGAAALGWENRIGTLEPGKIADIIAVKGDPVLEIECMRDVVFVMQNGQIQLVDSGREL
jgi:imidazolonepropionase-like amidohydrolase